MRFAKCFLLTAAVCGLCMAVRAGRIPCTYTAKIIGHSVHNQRDPNPRHYLMNFTQSCIVNKMWAQEGFLPSGYVNQAAKEVFIAPSKEYSINPVFDHKSCSILPSTRYFDDNDDLCFYFPEEFGRTARNIKCPDDSPHAKKVCDLYQGYDKRNPYQEPVAVSWYVFAGTFTPVRLIRSGDDLDVFDFASFDTRQPDPKAFEIPKEIMIICKDFTDSGNAPAYNERSDLSDELVNDDLAIARINAKAKSWKAGHNKVFDGLTHAQVAEKLRLSPKRAMMGNTGSFLKNSVPPKTSISRDSIPESFDASKAWPDCGIDSIRYQGQCGSCYSFGSTTVLGDRFCIALNSTTPIRLSPQYPVSCYYDLYGCGGGFVDDVWKDLVKIGTVDENCLAYTATDGYCPAKCDDGSDLRFYKSRDAYPLYTYNDLKDTMEKVQMDIMTNGPVHAAFFLFDDFLHYTSGVYQRTPGSVLRGGHHFKIYGWGVDKDSGLPYWLVANSWGKDWGENGNFRIIRGVNDCCLEDNLGAGRPLLH